MDRENVLSRTITNILKKVLSRDVAMLFTATKQTEDKNVFKGTPLCSCILGKQYFYLNLLILFNIN